MIEIRSSHGADIAAIEALYRSAFPDEDLLPLVGELLGLTEGVLSLVALRDAAVVGHVIFTACAVAQHTPALALLGPLAVDARARGQGLGSALVSRGLAAVAKQGLAKQGVEQVFVLGDPRYYGRFGFITEQSVLPAYDIPEEWRPAWQSLRLAADGPRCEGRLLVPAPWSHRRLWSP